MYAAKVWRVTLSHQLRQQPTLIIVTTTACVLQHSGTFYACLYITSSKLLPILVCVCGSRLLLQYTILRFRTSISPTAADSIYYGTRGYTTFFRRHFFLCPRGGGGSLKPSKNKYLVNILRKGPSPFWFVLLLTLGRSVCRSFSCFLCIVYSRGTRYCSTGEQSQSNSTS